MIQVFETQVGVDPVRQVDIRVSSQPLYIRRWFACLDQVGDERVPQSVKVGLAVIDLIRDLGCLQYRPDHFAPATIRRPSSRPEFRLSGFPSDPVFQELHHFLVSKRDASRILVFVWEADRRT